MARWITDPVLNSPTRLAHEVARHPGAVARAARLLAGEANQARLALNDHGLGPAGIAARLEWLARVADQGHRAAHALVHAGRCARCGTALHDPVSVGRGVGPDCWHSLGSHYLDVVLRDTGNAVEAWADVARRARGALARVHTPAERKGAA